MNSTDKTNELGYLSIAFERLVLKRFVKYHYIAFGIVFMGACLFDLSHIAASLIIGFGIGLFTANSLVVAFLRRRLVVCKGAPASGQYVSADVNGVLMRFNTEHQSVRWISSEKTAFWYFPGLIFCDLRSGIGAAHSVTDHGATEKR